MIIREMYEARKKSIERRLDPANVPSGGDEPMMSASNIKYELAERTQAINYGGIGLIHQIARQSGLIDAIDENLELLKIHRPYHESDHVLNLAYNAICDGRVLQDIELRRNDEAFLNAFLGAGFHGVEILSWSDQPWQTVEGIEFRAMTVSAYKGKAGPCWERLQAVIYKGPWSAVEDDDHHRLNVLSQTATRCPRL